ncbi:MAG TPA: thioesterase family protein, partial [Acidimicrobiales bacterium]
PWDPDALHGGPPAALVAGAMQEAVATFARDELTGDDGTTVDFFPARFTAELLRPVPLAELVVDTTLRRKGRKICIADATLTGPDGKVCLSATLATIRRQPFDQPRSDELTVPPPPSTGWAIAIAASEHVMFAREGVEHRLVAGRFEDPGPATDWIRMAAPMVDGREPTPLERVMAAADFGNGVSKWFDMEEVLFLNPDLTVNLHRLPVGEWVCIDAVTRLGTEGIGLAESLLFDQEGPIGRATQSLLVEGR